jgi:hypothetical protein
MKLYLMQLALLQPLGVPVPGYLIQTEDRANILIDTGFPRRFMQDEAKTRASTRKLVEVIRRGDTDHPWTRPRAVANSQACAGILRLMTATFFTMEQIRAGCCSHRNSVFGVRVKT